MKIRLAVSGTREQDDLIEFEVLSALQYVEQVIMYGEDFGIECVIQGGATGVDTIVKGWARQRGIEVIEEEVTKEEWEKHGKSAGPRRNSRLFNHEPNFYLAIPGPTSKGTWDFVKKAAAKKVPGIIWPRLLWWEKSHEEVDIKVVVKPLKVKVEGGGTLFEQEKMFEQVRQKDLESEYREGEPEPDPEGDA